MTAPQYYIIHTLRKLLCLPLVLCYRFCVYLIKVMTIVVNCHKPDLPRVKLVAVLATVVSDCTGVKSGDSRLKFPGLETVTK